MLTAVEPDEHMCQSLQQTTVWRGPRHHEVHALKAWHTCALRLAASKKQVDNPKGSTVFSAGTSRMGAVAAAAAALFEKGAKQQGCRAGVQGTGTTSGSCLCPIAVRR